MLRCSMRFNPSACRRGYFFLSLCQPALWGKPWPRRSLLTCCLRKRRRDTPVSATKSLRCWKASRTRWREWPRSPRCWRRPFLISSGRASIEFDPHQPNQLVIGPYQGQLGCLRIAFGRGVCGTSAARRQALIIADVEAFEGHIACDSRSRSEIVVPVFDATGELQGVLDVDSAELSAFDETDAVGLTAILTAVFGASNS